MAPRLSGQTSIFGVVFFVSKSLLGIEGQRKIEKFAIFTRKPRSHARILIYRTWPIATVMSIPSSIAAVTCINAASGVKYMWCALAFLNGNLRGKNDNR